MTVLIVIPNEEEVGGVASVITNLARELKSRGHQIYFLYAGDMILLKRKFIWSEFQCFALRMQMPFGERNPLISLLAFLVLFPIGLFQVLYLIRKYQIQVVNVQYPAEWLFYLAICRRILAIKLVTSVHGAEIFPTGRPLARYSRPFKFLLSSSDVVVAPSKGFVNQFLTVFPYLADKTVFIYNGINLSEFMVCAQKPTAREGYGYILCVSACKEQKALDVLLRAFKQLHEVDHTIRLIIVGDGPLRQSLTDLAFSLGIRDRVQFVGLQGRQQVVKLLHGCEIFVLPSRFETFGIAILEAWACQKPVIATTAGGIPEVIDNERNGILVEPDDPCELANALIRVLRDSTLRQALASNGYDTVQKRFRSEKTGSAYEELFAARLQAEQGKAA